MARPAAQLGGVILLYGAWAANIHVVNQLNAPAERAMALESMLIFSLPFQIMTAVVLVTLVVQLRRGLSRQRRTG
jgi:hypothetical protein